LGNATNEGELKKPTDVAVTSNGFVYVVDFGNEKFTILRD